MAPPRPQLEEQDSYGEGLLGRFDTLDKVLDECPPCLGGCRYWSELVLQIDVGLLASDVSTLMVAASVLKSLISSAYFMKCFSSAGVGLSSCSSWPSHANSYSASS